MIIYFLKKKERTSHIDMARASQQQNFLLRVTDGHCRDTVYVYIQRPQIANSSECRMQRCSPITNQNIYQACSFHSLCMLLLLDVISVYLSSTNNSYFCHTSVLPLSHTHPLRHNTNTSIQHISYGSFIIITGYKQITRISLPFIVIITKI